MIILEGPDGAGKTSLLSRLSDDLHLERGPRACTSLGGPVANLEEWTWNDLRSWRDASFIRIYDRYPLISDLIYAPVLARPLGMSLDMMRSVHPYFQQSTLVIFCLPPLREVKRNLVGEEQLSGVPEHIEEIYSQYRATAQGWPGQSMVWDYTRQDLEYASLKGRCQDYINTREGN